MVEVKFQEEIRAVIASLEKAKLDVLRKLEQGSICLVGVNSIYLPEELIVALKALPVHINELDEKLSEKLQLLIHIDKDGKDLEKIEKLKKNLEPESYLRLEHPKENSLEDYAESLEKLKEFLQEKLHRKYTDKNLLKAIKTLNETRYILSQLSEIHRVNNKLISQKDLQKILDLSWVLPREVFNKISKKLLKSTRFIPSSKIDSLNLIICGSKDNYSFKSLLEEHGGLISCDTQARNYPRFSKIVTEKRPFIEAIAESYFNQYPTVFFTQAENRIKNLKKLIDIYAAKGLIYQVENPDAYAEEFKLLKQEGVKLLELDFRELKEKAEALLEKSLGDLKNYGGNFILVCKL